ncbi:MAG: hypothetical protein WD875_19575 [Pirellulales bacterium]
MNDAPLSPFDDSPFVNPYASPQFSQPVMARSVERGPPTFPKVVAIIDLVFCAIRALIVLLSIVAIFGGNVELVETTGWLELISGAGIVVFGTIAAIGILSQADWAVPFGWITVAFTAASTVVGVSQIPIVLRSVPADMPNHDAFVTGTIIGAVGMAIVRVALILMYAFALQRFSAWRRQRSRAAFR